MQLYSQMHLKVSFISDPVSPRSHHYFIHAHKQEMPSRNLAPLLVFLPLLLVMTVFIMSQNQLPVSLCLACDCLSKWTVCEGKRATWRTSQPLFSPVSPSSTSIEASFWSVPPYAASNAFPQADTLVASLSSLERHDLYGSHTHRYLRSAEGIDVIMTKPCCACSCSPRSP